MDTLESLQHGGSSTLQEPLTLQHGFWPSTRLAHAMEDEFTLEGNVREEYGEDDHFVRHRRDRLAPLFRVGRDLYKGYFVALRPCSIDDRPFWIGRAMSDSNSNRDLPNTVDIQFFRPMSRNKDVLKYYTGWDTNKKLRWTVEKGVDISSQDSTAVFTAWKSRIRKADEDSSQGIEAIITLPDKQIKIIKASLAGLVASV